MQGESHGILLLDSLFAGGQHQTVSTRIVVISIFLCAGLTLFSAHFTSFHADPFLFVFYPLFLVLFHVCCRGRVDDLSFFDCLSPFFFFVN